MGQRRTWKKQVTNLPKGKVIQGKWHQHRYEILGKLGEGAIGVVYLCRSKQGVAALKISDKQASITLEVNVLKALKQVPSVRLGPALFDVDDWVSENGVVYSFYVMEYVQGERVDRFIKRHGQIVIGPLFEQLIDHLDKLHQVGWVFGDLKVENLIVSSPPTRIRWVDVGGTTQIGRSIKEYTELYDRGYWGLGSRKAEPSYDFFSLTMVLILIYIPQLKRPTVYDKKFLLKTVDRIKPLQPYAPILKKTLLGKYKHAAQIKQDFHNLPRPSQRHLRNRQKNYQDLLKEAAWILLISCLYFLLSFLVI